MTELERLGAELNEKRQGLYTIYKELEGKYDQAKYEEYTRRKEELDGPDGIGTKYANLRNAAEGAAQVKQAMDEYNQPSYKFGHSDGGNPDTKAQTKSLTDMVRDAVQFKHRMQNSGKFIIDGVDGNDPALKGFDPRDYLASKTLISTSAGFAPPNYRTGLVVGYAVNVPDVLDIIPQGMTDLQIVKHMEQTTRTNNSAAKAEGSAATDSAYVWTERSNTVEKITGWLPVTDEQLADNAGLEALITNDLQVDTRNSLQSLVLTGDGNTPNLNGFLTRITQTQAKSTDSVPDAIFKGMQKVRFTGRAKPSHVVMHPNDWQDVALLTDLNGNYIFGGPGSAAPPMMWGLPVVQNTDETENTALLGDFPAYSMLLYKQGITIAVSDSHSTYFTEGKQVIKATLRVTLQVKRVNAFCTVTGI